MNVTFKLPQLLLVCDYHDFELFLDCLKQLQPSKRVKIKELDWAGSYVGVAYSGKCPDKKTILALLEEEGLEVEEEEPEEEE